MKCSSERRWLNVAKQTHQLPSRPANINGGNTKMFVSVLNENLFHYTHIFLYIFNPKNIKTLLSFFVNIKENYLHKFSQQPPLHIHGVHYSNITADMCCAYTNIYLSRRLPSVMRRQVATRTSISTYLHQHESIILQKTMVNQLTN